MFCPSGLVLIFFVYYVEIIHNFDNNRQLIKTVDTEDASLMLAKDGSFLWTGGKIASRYQGWFLSLDGGRFVKIIEDIRPCGRGAIESIAAGSDNVKRAGTEFGETFRLLGSNSLFYELEKFSPIEIFFDIKDAYDSPEFGRNYRVWMEDGAVMVSFKQAGGFLPEFFVALWGDFGMVETNEEWIKHNYKNDRLRQDEPAERWVFKPVELAVSRIAIGAGVNKKEAIRTAREAWRAAGRAKKKALPPDTENLNKNLSAVKKAGGMCPAREAAANALGMMRVKKGGREALRAGLPWFFQVWRRDEAVSLRGMSFCDRKAAKEILWRQIDDLAAEGYEYKDSADAVGWLFLRAAEFIKNEKANINEIERIFFGLERAIERLLAEDTKNFLAVHKPKMTWMDSLDRGGAAVEIQALRLNMYGLAGAIAFDMKKRSYYSDLEEKTAAAVRKKFFHNGNLADRIDLEGKAEFCHRPNIFLAAYIYPQLLKKNEWRGVFDAALKALWLDWGGLSTLDKKDPDFKGDDAGIDPAAYHNGDSWFWVNNLAAVSMVRLDKSGYANYIERIFEASANDILWHSAVGCASEISSASGYAPAGCPNQAWSNATFLEMCHELGR